MSKLKEKLGIITATTGGTSSIVGVVGAGCATACAGGCGGILTGVITASLGAGSAAFLHQYSTFFVLAGVGLLILGAIIIVKRRKNSCQIIKNN